MKYQYTVSIVLFVLISGALYGQSETTPVLEEILPARTQASIAPVSAVVAEMPPLPPMALQQDLLVSDLEVVVLPPIDIPVPEIPPEAVTPVAMIRSEDQVYFDATLGGGSLNTILGGINVYRLGDGPQFRVGYDHRGSDGFNLQQPGAGFFLQQNTLDVALTLGTAPEQRSSLDIAGDYRDQRFGLQKQSPFYSQDLRQFSMQVEGALVADSAASLRGGVDFSDDLRVLATGETDLESERNEYRRVVPYLSGSLEWPRLRMDLTGRYDGLFPSAVELADSSLFDLSLGLEVVPLDGLTVGADVTALYGVKEGVYFPAEGFLSFRGAERWETEIRGGYRVTHSEVVSYWDDYPALEWDPERNLDDRRLPLERSWFGTASAGMVVIPGLLGLRGDLGFHRYQDQIVPGEFDSTRSAYPWVLENRAVSNGNLVAELTVLQSVTFQGGWRGEWGDRLPGVPSQVATVSVEGRYSRLTAKANGEMPLVSAEALLPEIDLELRYDVVRDLQFMLYASDILAPGNGDGRSLRGVLPDDDDPFVAPGLEVGAMIRVQF